MATEARRSVRALASSGITGRSDVKGLARANGLNFDGVALEEGSSHSVRSRLGLAAAATGLIAQTQESEAKTSAHKAGAAPQARTETPTDGAAGRAGASQVASPSVDAAPGAKGFSASHDTSATAAGSSTALPLINGLTPAGIEEVSSEYETPSTNVTDTTEFIETRTDDDGPATTDASVTVFEGLSLGDGTAEEANNNAPVVPDTVNLTASTVSEGAAASYLFTATLSRPSQGITTVHTDQGDIAIADGDTEGTLTIASGNTEDVYADASSLTATITGISSGLASLGVGTASATAHITDTLDITTVDLTGSTVSEGPAASYAFTATLSHLSQGITTVHTDRGDITIPDGATTGTLTIAAGNNEDVYLDASNLTATITGTSGGNFEELAIGNAAATAQIDDTITPATVDLSASTVNEGAGASYVFTATLSHVSQGVTTVHTDQGDISIADGATTGTLTIAAGNDEDVYADASSLTATITGTSGGNFENLAVGTGSATAHVVDTLTTTIVTLDDAVAGGAPGTATITAHVDHAVTSNDLELTLSNGATVTIAVGETSGVSSPFAASADTTLGIGGTSGGNFEALDTTATALLAVNDAPVNTVPVAQSVAEDSDLVITGLSISDADAGNATNLTTTLSVAHGRLTVSSAGGAAVSGSGTGSVTLTGSVDQINTTLSAANNIVYRGVADFHGSDTLSIVTNDQGNAGIDPGLTGTTGNEQDSDTVAITVTPVNDAPVATITPASYSATEQTSLDLKNTGLSIGDVDAGAGTMTVTLSVTEGMLTVAAGGSGAAVSDSGTSSVTITGTVAQINALLSTDATSSVSYSDTSDTPSASATLTLTVHDNGNTGGGDLVASDTATIGITPVNDAPVLNLTPLFNNYVEDQFDSQAYDLNSGNVSWADSWTESEGTSPTSGSIQIADDPSIGGSNLALRLGDGVNTVTEDVTIVRTANLAGATAATLSFDYDQISADNNEDLIVNAWNGSAFVEIGRILGSSANGVGSFSVELDPAYISANTQIQLVAMGSLDSNEFYYVDNLRIAFNNQLSFTEGAPALVLDTGATVSDAELDAANNFDGATLTLARSGAANADDVFSGSGPLSLSGGNVVHNGTTVGTYTQESGLLAITFNGNATGALVDSVLQNIAYINASDAPPASVEIAYTFSDGNSGAQGSGGAHSSTSSVVVNLINVNDPAEISGLTVSESSIEFVATDPDNAFLSLTSPFGASFGDPTISSGAVTSLTPTEQGSVVSGTLEVTDGAATTSVIGLHLGRGGGNSFTASDIDTAIYGFAGNDTLTGGAGSDWIFGGDGNDKITGAQNDRVLDGGAGTDTLFIATDFTSVSDAQISNIEEVELEAAVTLDLSNQTESFTITGSTGDDTIVAGSGDDTITGDDGADTMTGGAGADTFIINTGESVFALGGSGDNGTVTGFDTITDFETGADTLDLQGSIRMPADTSGTNGADSVLTIGGQTVKSHAITNGIITFDDNNTFNAGSTLSLTSLANVAAVLDYLTGNDLGSARTTVAFAATLDGVPHTFVYEQISNGVPSSPNNSLLVDLANVTLTPGGTSLSSLNAAGRIAPAGAAGAPINLALTDPAGHIGPVTVTISGMPSGWTLSEGSDTGGGTWKVETANVGALSIISPADYRGAMAFHVEMSWTKADGSDGLATFADNVEAYAPGNPIFAIAGDDNLTGSSGADLMVFAQPIGHDVVYNFDVALDLVDLVGFDGMTSFADLQLANGSNGSAVLTLGDGMTITFDGIDAGALTSSNFLFDLVPITTNADSIVVSDGAILPLSGIVENSGTIALNAVDGATDLQIIQHGITLQGGGLLQLSDNGGNFISGTSGAVQFTNVDNTISGSGQLGDGQMTLINQGRIVASGVNALDIDTGENDVVNYGTLEATGTGGLVIHGDLANFGLLWANGGDISIEGNVTGSGSALINGGGTFELGGQFAGTITIDAGTSGTLELKRAADFAGSLAGFDGDDQIYIADIAAGDATLSYIENAQGTGGLLTLSDGQQAANIALFGEYAAQGFQFGINATGGTAIVYLAHDEHLV